MVDFVAHIANCLILGYEFEENGSTKISLFLEGKHIHVIQSQDVLKVSDLRDKFHGKSIPSTKVIVKDVTENELEFVRELIYSMCNLLSFITCSQVVFYAQEFPNHSSLGAVIGKTNIYNNLLDIRNGSIVKDFISTVWSKFRDIEKSRNLYYVFDYIHNANYPGSTIESKLIFSFVTLESLKHTYAKQKGYTYNGHGFVKSIKKRTIYYSFIKLVEDMLQEIKIPIVNKDIIKKLRNEIIHSGLSESDFSSNYKIFREIQNIIRKYLAKLLGYNKTVNRL